MDGSSLRVQGPPLVFASRNSTTAAHPCACRDHTVNVRKLVAHHRLIPARAGTTSKFAGMSEPITAHPCACRDHVAQPSIVDGDARLIPARAGTTPAPVGHRRPKAAHPCACRDHMKPPLSMAQGAGSSLRVQGPRGDIIVEMPLYDGSSLRVQGPLLDKVAQHRAERLIPARAGTTAAIPPSRTGTSGSSLRVQGPLHG